MEGSSESRTGGGEPGQDSRSRGERTLEREPLYSFWGLSGPHRTQFPNHHLSVNRGLPLPLGRGVCETKSKKGRARDRKPFMHRLCSAHRGIETMVLDHGLGRGQTIG